MKILSSPSCLSLLSMLFPGPLRVPFSTSFSELISIGLSIIFSAANSLSLHLLASGQGHCLQRIGFPTPTRTPTLLSVNPALSFASPQTPRDEPVHRETTAKASRRFARLARLAHFALFFVGLCLTCRPFCLFAFSPFCPFAFALCVSLYLSAFDNCKLPLDSGLAPCHAELRRP